MKPRVLRAFALFLCLAALLSLTGCIQLDRLEARCAYWTDESHTALTLNGERYVLVSTSFSFETVFYPADSVYVADGDVPLLLVTTVGEELAPAWDGALLLCYGNYATDPESGVVTRDILTYCREDKLSELSALPTDAPLTRFYLWTGTDTPTEDEAVSAVLAPAVLTPLSGVEADRAAALAEEVWFSDYALYLTVDATDALGLSDTYFFLFRSSDGDYYLEYDEDPDSVLYYAVPEADASVLDQYLRDRGLLP